MAVSKKTQASERQLLGDFSQPKTPKSGQHLAVTQGQDWNLSQPIAAELPLVKVLGTVR